MSAPRKAIFLDRDGVLNELVYYSSTDEHEAPRILADLRLIPGAGAALRRAHEAGWSLFVVTNQPSYAKAKTSLEALQAIHQAVIQSLDAPLVESYQCFHHPDAAVASLRHNCECRKPGAFFLREAARVHQVDLRQSWMIGDQDSDAICGRSAGCRVALIDNPDSSSKRNSAPADLYCRDLAECIDKILRIDD